MCDHLIIIKWRHAAFSLLWHSVSSDFFHISHQASRRGFSHSRSRMSHKLAGRITAEGKPGQWEGPRAWAAGASGRSVPLSCLFQEHELVPTWWVECDIQEQWEHENFVFACAVSATRNNGWKQKIAQAEHSCLGRHSTHTYTHIYNDLGSPRGISHTHSHLVQQLSPISGTPPPLFL